MNCFGVCRDAWTAFTPAADIGSYVCGRPQSEALGAPAMMEGHCALFVRKLGERVAEAARRIAASCNPALGIVPQHLCQPLVEEATSIGKEVAAFGSHIRSAIASVFSDNSSLQLTGQT